MPVSKGSSPPFRCRMLAEAGVDPFLKDSKDQSAYDIVTHSMFAKFFWLAFPRMVKTPLNDASSVATLCCFLTRMPTDPVLPRISLDFVLYNSSPKLMVAALLETVRRTENTSASVYCECALLLFALCDSEYPRLTLFQIC